MQWITYVFHFKLTVWGTDFLSKDLTRRNNAYISRLEFFNIDTQFLNKILYMQWITDVFSFKLTVWRTELLCKDLTR